MKHRKEKPKDNRKIDRKWLFALLLFLFCLCIAALLFVRSVLTAQPSYTKRMAVCYQKSTQFYLASSRNKQLLPRTGRDCVLLFSEDGKWVCYTENAQDASGKKDLYLFDATHDSKPLLIAHGVGEKVQITANGTCVLYTKQNEHSGEEESCIFQREKEKITVFAQDADEVFAEPSGERLFYTLKQDGKSNLYTYRISRKQSECLAQDVALLRMFFSDGECELFYQCQTTDGNAVYRVTQGKMPEMLAANIIEILFDDYQIGGNLYFLRSSAQAQWDWRQVLGDRNRLTDQGIQEPQRKDYPAIYSFDEAYEKAWERYEQKLLRDSIRTALDEAVKTLPTLQDIADLYVYHDGSVVLLQEGIVPQQLLALSTGGAVQAVLRELTVQESGVDIQSLSPQADQTPQSCALELLKQNITFSEPLLLQANFSLLRRSLPDASDTQFVFSKSGNYLFAAQKEEKGKANTLYCYDANGDVRAIQKCIGVTQYVVDGETVYLLIPQAGESAGILFSLSDGELQQLATGVYQFYCHGEAGVLLLSHYQNNLQPTVTLSLYHKAQIFPVDEGVTLESIRSCGAGGIAYLKHAAGKNGGDLYIYTDEKRILLDVDVSRIQAFLPQNGWDDAALEQ